MLPKQKIFNCYLQKPLQWAISVGAKLGRGDAVRFFYQSFPPPISVVNYFSLAFHIDLDLSYLPRIQYTCRHSEDPRPFPPFLFVCLRGFQSVARKYFRLFPESTLRSWTTVTEGIYSSTHGGSDLTFEVLHPFRALKTCGSLHNFFFRHKVRPNVASACIHQYFFHLILTILNADVSHFTWTHWRTCITLCNQNALHFRSLFNQLIEMEQLGVRGTFTRLFTVVSKNSRIFLYYRFFMPPREVRSRKCPLEPFGSLGARRSQLFIEG